MSDHIFATNPIMPGFYPDPSICAVGEDFYLCNSTFAYFPGLSIMHSKDLVHWEQIGNALDRHSQIPLEGAGHSQGLYAPTIRYNDGTFYVICTNVTHGGNFIVTAENPEGPWSEPHYLDDADGIDPSLFFEDGKCYYIGTHPNPEGPKYNGDWYIYISELDTKEWKLKEKINVWNGALKGCIWPEGPHLYKENGYYYIMHAEGGTGPDHSEMICRSREIFGPYENNPRNPIITHRHLGEDYPIKYVGHADLIKTVNDEWYMAMLAVRPLNRFTTMGRETFLARVTWENDWPVVNPGIGKLTDEVEIDLKPWDPEKDEGSYTRRTNNKTAIPGSNRDYDFTKMKELGDEFLMLRNFPDDMFRLTDEGLKLKAGKDDIKAVASPSYIAIRQQHHHFTSTATFDAAALKEGESAGLVLMQNNLYNLRAEVKDGECFMIVCKDGKDEIVGSTPASGKVTVEIKVDGLTAGAGCNGTDLGETSIETLSTEVAGGFVGCCIGIYASANGNESDTYVTFTKLTYKGSC
ncbi:MAG: glycoside hydrolase family 43 protein [Clostridiales bacterium]|nr:glycoside hydrolase family 43 protein [Clostridiales bacterium]